MGGHPGLTDPQLDALNRVFALTEGRGADLMIDAAAGLIDPFDLLRWVEQWAAEREKVKGFGKLINHTEPNV